ncbi:MAG: hypothetical protein LQ340_003795, partial [Diploschistes diacapsis]
LFPPLPSSSLAITRVNPVTPALDTMYALAGQPSFSVVSPATDALNASIRPVICGTDVAPRNTFLWEAEYLLRRLPAMLDTLTSRPCGFSSGSRTSLASSVP